MSAFSVNIILMFFWVILTADFTAINFLIGFIAGWVVLWLIQILYGRTNYFVKQYDIIVLFILFNYQLFASSLQVVWDVLTPEDKSKPGILAIPLDVKTDTQILILSSFISLTPGTLTLDISEDQKTLYVHCMFLTDPQEMIKAIKDGIESRIIRLTEE